MREPASYLRYLTAACAGVVLMLAAGRAPAQAPEPLHIHMISGSNEYESEASLRSYQRHLEDRYRVEVTASWVEDRADDLPGIEHVPKADLLLVFARRLELPENQMETIRGHWEAGKPVVGIRTASHAFRDRTNRVFDRQVLGGNYDGHFDDETVSVRNVAEHPVLEGVRRFISRKLYKAGALAEDAVVLQEGSIEGSHTHPVTWVHRYNGGRTFYTSLGVPEDFADPDFLRLVTNALFWTAERDREALRRKR